MIYPNSTKRKRKHRNDSVSTQLRTKSYNDLVFEITCDAADYDSTWSSSITDEKLFKICLTFESTILFAAREGWVCSKSPSCRKASCSSALDRSCYLQRRSAGSYRWISRCCKTSSSILKGSMFYKSTLGKVPEISLPVP